MSEKKFEIRVGERIITIKTTNWAEQASGACLVECGQTLVLVTAVMSPYEKEDIDFFPLTVDYEERFYAAGKIFGSRFIRREIRPTDEAILTARMIDRAIRPLFPESFRKEVQIIITCLSWDGENDPDILGLLGASFVLSNSKIPWEGPLGGLRIAKTKNEFIFNPTYQERKEAEMDLVLAGVENKDEILINMIEMSGKEISEDNILKAIEAAEPEIKKIINSFKEAKKEIGQKKEEILPLSFDTETTKEISRWLGNKLEKALIKESGESKLKAVESLREELLNYLKEEAADNQKIKESLYFFDKQLKEIIIENILKKDKRPDGRKSDEIRPISCQVEIIPRAHGSGFFERGLTKVLSVLTLGGPSDSLILEGMEIVAKKRFMHHYNFPPFCSGEVSSLRGPKRREIGHGNLAEKALVPLLPEQEEFPYTIRIVSEVVSSNGSTSMASVCASSLALMDAGVPIKEPAAGISIGLVTDESSGKYKVLTDIQGPEDHFGDMDFKVAGTKNGITAIQLDVKIKGLTKEIVKEALEKAKKARLFILETMRKIIDKPRETLSPLAPRIQTIWINPSKIGEVIGPKGSMINKIIQECNVEIDIDDSTGKVFITGESQEGVEKATNWIKELTKEISVGEVYTGTVKKITEFGAFVDILPGQSGLVHISKFVPHRLRSVKEVVKEGDKIPVKVISIDENGRINLSAIDAGFKPKPKK